MLFRLAPEPRLLPRLLAATVAGLIAGITVAIPAVPAPVAVAVVGVALAVIVPLARTGHAEPEPDLPQEELPQVEEIAVVNVGPRPVRPTTYDDPLLATAEDAGVYTPRHSRELREAETNTIPAVTAEATP